MSKNLLVLAASAALALTVGIGCNKSSEGGVSGTPNTFKVGAPAMATTIKQGDKQTVSITVDRDSGFQQSVKLDAQAPKGLKVDMDKSTVKPSDAKEVSLSITADKDCALGDHMIKITGKPDTGNAVTVDVKVTVAAMK